MRLVIIFCLFVYDVIRPNSDVLIIKFVDISRHMHGLGLTGVKIEVVFR